MTTEDYRMAEKVTPNMQLLGLPMNDAGLTEVHAFIRQVILNNEKAIALNLNVYCLNLALKHVWLYEFIKKAQFVFCDGDGVRWGLKLRGYSPPPKITYNKWIWQLAEFCEVHGFSIFLLGAQPGVAAEAATNLKKRYPALRVAGTHHGHFQKSGAENEKVISQISLVRPDILLTCFGMPAQEKWIMENWHRIPAHIFLKGGAAFDYASGRLAMAPEWIIRFQMEWLFRFFQDPVRLFSRYILGNPYFIYRVLKDLKNEK